jgi:hypothetical protein
MAKPPVSSCRFFPTGPADPGAHCPRQKIPATLHLTAAKAPWLWERSVASVKYKRIEKKLDTIVQLLETVVSRMPREIAKAAAAAAGETQEPEAAPLQPALVADTPKGRRDPLALLEDREEWLKIVEGWK